MDLVRVLSNLRRRVEGQRGWTWLEFIKPEEGVEGHRGWTLLEFANPE